MLSLQHYLALQEARARKMSYVDIGHQDDAQFSDLYLFHEPAKYTCQVQMILQRRQIENQSTLIMLTWIIFTINQRMTCTNRLQEEESTMQNVASRSKWHMIAGCLTMLR